MVSKGEKNVATAVFSLATLYIGKTSGIAVAFLFLPIYSRSLGADQFGLVAVLMSLQALLIMLDLGMSTVLSREISAGCPAQEARRLLSRAELSLVSFYGIFLLAASVVLAADFVPKLSWVEGSTSIALLLLLVLQNLNYSAQLALKAYRVGTALQISGVLLRSGATWYALEHIASTFLVFVLVQVATAILHLGVSRITTLALLKKTPAIPNESGLKQTMAECLALVGRARSLVLSGIAGAAALQLDKTIVSLFMGSREVAPYFLAATLSTTPVGVLAAPIVQFFQPKMIGAIAQGNRVLYDSQVKWFILAILMAVCIPTALMIAYIDEIVSVWLKDGGMVGEVAAYSKILLFGNGISALGYVPYVIIIANQDYGYQASFSAAMTVALLTLVAISAMSLSIASVCYAYVAYFFACTLGLTLRVKIKGFRYT